ncbi:hypothetical protein [Enterococcus sp. HY326]|uniref:hypothetical protein n=1 Tax=Enterococcus sp. HY326 TaxID=2971265 RepID=UPI0022409CEA|nr:hypothetical protein [Enterococcus sp. HY326]
MTDKKNEIPLEHLTDEQLDDFLSYTETFTEDNFQNIQQRFMEQRDTLADSPVLHKKKKRKKIGWLIAAAASLMLLTAFTQADRLISIYYRLFGNQAEEMLLNTDKLTETVSDQGLELRALASFRDTNSTHFLAELTDLTGDRLSGDMILNDWQMNGGGNAQVIDYNPDTKTATILVHSIDTFDGGANNYAFALNSFSSRQVENNEVVEVDLSQYLTKDATWTKDSERSGFGGGMIPELEKKYGFTLEELGAEMLLPEEKTAVISEEKQVSLSNIAYKDDLLHLQIKEPNTVQRQYTFVSFVNKTTGKEIKEIASFGIDYGTHNNETGRGDYEELVFDLPQDELSQYDLKLESLDYEVYQTGDWAIKLKEPQSLPTVELGDVDITSAGYKVALKDVKLSGISLSFVSDLQTKEDLSAEELPLNIQVRMKDGQEFPYYDEDSLTVASYQKTEDAQIFGEYLDVDDVEALIINGVEVKVG